MDIGQLVKKETKEVQGKRTQEDLAEEVRKELSYFKSHNDYRSNHETSRNDDLYLF